MRYFDTAKLITTDPAFDLHDAHGDVRVNKLLGLPELFGDDATPTGLPLGGKLIVVAAAGDLEGERMLRLNGRLIELATAGEEFCVIVAGAGALCCATGRYAGE